MAELLLELFSEEIPARMQARAADDLKRLVTAGLKEAGLTFETAEAHVTSRRLVLAIDGLPVAQPDVKEERKGPRVGAPEKAIEGFLKAAGLDSLEACETRTDPKKGDFYVVVIEKKGQKTTNVLLSVVFDAVIGLNWPKKMRWADTNFSYVRPLHNILLIFDGKPVEFVLGLGKRGGALGNLGWESVRADVNESVYRSFLDRSGKLVELDEPVTRFLKASNKTFGHRFLAPEPFEVSDFADYKKKLRDAKVLLDAAERRQLIQTEAEKLARDAGLALKEDPGLLVEVAGLIEWPVVLMGAIDDAFMNLPDEVLTTSMRSHQKYFSTQDSSGNLASRFVFVANNEAADGGAQIVVGNERVLRARLADAKFFWDHDRKAPLESRVEALGERIFHARLGSDLERVTRIRALAAAIAEFVPDCGAIEAERAALLCKADLSTEMVGEFPELQGIMGRYYARLDGESDAVADAIAQHYSPQGPGDDCPRSPVAVAVALADKIDTLTGFFTIGEKPTGSKDPYALRRAALGVIRLIVENGLRLPLLKVFDAAGRLYAEQGVAATDGFDTKELLDFFADRLKVHLREKGVRHDLITAVFALGGEDDLVRLLARVDALAAFLGSDDGADLLTAFRRAANIVRIEEKKDGEDYSGEADTGLLRQDEEMELSKKLGEIMPQVAEQIRSERFDDAMGTLARLRAPVDAFFDDVTVNCDEPPLRRNRLRLLSTIRSALSEVADFSTIEGQEK